jgi:hypothetical protein
MIGQEVAQVDDVYLQGQDPASTFVAVELSQPSFNP